MKTSEIIKLERKAAGLTQEELASMLGIQGSAVAKYENGRVDNIKRSVLEKMAKIFDCSPAYLMGFTESRKEEDKKTSSDPLPHPSLLQVHKRKIPLLGEIACGEPIIINPEYETFTTVSDSVHADFALIADGDSMINAGIRSGSLVFIRKQEAVDNGEIAAVAIGDEVTLKRVYYYPDQNQLILNPENPAFPPMIYSGSELEEIHILGRAVACQIVLR